MLGIEPLEEQSELLTSEPALFSSLFFFFETKFHYVALTRTNYVDQAGLELTEFCLPLPPKCWDKTCTSTFTSPLFKMVQCVYGGREGDGVCVEIGTTL